MVRTLTRNTSADELLRHRPRIAAIPNTSAICSRLGEQTKQHSEETELFKFGKVIRPERDGPDRTQLCITRTMLAKIVALSRGRAPPEFRKMEKSGFVGFVCHRNHGSTLVVSTRFGWLAQNRRHPKEAWLTLGHEHVGFYLLFPTANAAISAVEIIENAPPDTLDCLGCLCWLGPRRGLHG
jgi:hypothetical protein